MEKQEFLTLLQKFNEGSASEEEKAFLLAYYNLFEAKSDITEMLSEDKRDQLKKQIKTGLDAKIARSSHQVKRPFLLFRQIAAAAILIILLGAGVTFYLVRTGFFKGRNYAKNIVSPGGNKAILTLANGTQIILSNVKNGVLTLQNGTVIKKTANGQLVYDASASGNNVIAYNTITTPRGGQYTVILPDSSKVYLNSASSLRFPTSFAGTFRQVSLTGEAYFEISHNKNKPFMVASAGQTVKVLGTHFDINAYADERAIKTTLLEGSVNITASGKSVVLVPGQQSQVIQSRNLDTLINVVQNANVDEAVAWKNGYFQFENADLQTIMRQFSRWYDVKVVYEGQFRGRLFSGQIHRNLNAEQALELLNYANVHFNIDGKTITVTQ
jgi:transmembrane sensor